MIVRRCAGELIIAFSGERDSHTCKTANAQLRRGHILERSGRRPQHALDDRDAGLVETSGGTLITSWFPRWSSGTIRPGLLAKRCGSAGWGTGRSALRIRGDGRTGQECGALPPWTGTRRQQTALPRQRTFDGALGRRQSRSSLDSISGIIRNRKPKPAKLSVGSSAVRAPWSSYRHSSGISLLTPISFVSSRGGAGLALVLVCIDEAVAPAVAKVALDNSPGGLLSWWFRAAACRFHCKR